MDGGKTVEQAEASILLWTNFSETVSDIHLQDGMIYIRMSQFVMKKIWSLLGFNLLEEEGVMVHVVLWIGTAAWPGTGIH